MPLIISEPPFEVYDEEKDELVQYKGFSIQIEHSLLSISKWESIHCKCFVETNLSPSEFSDYIKCMTMSTPVSDTEYAHISAKNRQIIRDYINFPTSATRFGGAKQNDESGKKDAMTSEYIYYCMFANQIPKDCEKWHLNRLLNLIHIFSIKNKTNNGKKSNGLETMKSNAALNKARRAKYNSKG